MERAAVNKTEPVQQDWDSLPVRVYYEDTDAQGVVYFANYLRFMERGRTEWLRTRGFEQDSLRREQNLLFSLASTAVRFHCPAKFDDRLLVRTRVERVSGARVIFNQAVHRDDADEELLCSADCEVACISADEFKPRRVPKGLLDK